MQSVACSLEGRRRNRFLRTPQATRVFQAAAARRYLAADELAAVRDERLRNFVRHAFRTVPFYERLAASMRLDPEAIRCFDDLQLLPILTAAEVRDRPADFISRAVAKSACVPERRRHAGGAAAALPMSRSAAIEAVAMQWRFQVANGIEPGTWSCYFGGRNVVPRGQSRPPFWRTNYAERRIIFSPYHLSEQTVEAYVDAFNQYQCPWLHGHPHVLGNLSELVTAAGLTIDYPLRWITTHAETLLGIQRRAIRRAFGLSPRISYAAPCGLATIMEEPGGRLLVNEDHAAVEFLESGVDDTRRIVGTNLSNLAAPLLRYDTGDTVTVSSRLVQSHLPREVTSCTGASTDRIVLPSGVRIGRLERMFDDLVAVRTFLIVQHADLTIDIDIWTAPGFCLDDDVAIRDRVAARFGDARWLINYRGEEPMIVQRKLQVLISEAEQPSRAVVQPEDDIVVVE